VGQADRGRDDRACLRLAAKAVDEAAIDLEYIDRETAQVGERRVAGPSGSEIAMWTPESAPPMLRWAALLDRL